MNYDEIEKLIDKISREMKLDPKEVSSLSWLIRETKDYARCNRVSVKDMARCVQLPNHTGMCKIITRYGNTRPIIGYIPTASLLKLAENWSG